MTRIARPTNALEALDAHLALVAHDQEQWLALFADDAVVEFPYAASMGLPARLEGKDAIQSFFASVPDLLLNLVFRDVRRYPTMDPNIAIAEVHGSATVATTSRAYEQDYVMIIECRDGAIVRYREYVNVAVVHELFGAADEMSNTTEGR